MRLPVLLHRDLRIGRVVLTALPNVTDTMCTQRRWSFPLLALLPLLAVLGTTAQADDPDPPGRVARLAYEEGSVSLQPGGADGWVEAPINRPLTTGDALWTDSNGRAELQLDGSVVRLSGRTDVALLNVDDQITQIQLSAGTLIVRIRADNSAAYEIDAPNLAVSMQQPGVYRVSVDDSGTTTTVAVRSGQAQVTGGGADFSVDGGQRVVFSGTDTLTANEQPYAAAASPFDDWSADRDAAWDNSPSAEYVSDEVIGYSDLDNQGDWSPTPDYGPIWIPRRVRPGWAPYRFGHWVYIPPWGYTWVDDQPWGFAPFHYGRWVWYHRAWGWVPCAPRRRGTVAYVRPVYAPALVAWVGAGAGVAWFALGPHEVYVPAYHVSRRYVENINLSNTVVNRTVLNNIYNTTIVNGAGPARPLTYMNRNAPGAITATTRQVFTSSQPVANHTVQFDPRGARVQALAPPLVPTRQAIMGLGRTGAPRPPAAMRTRPVVARTAPPPPPPSFEQRRQALERNGGRPLAEAALRPIQPQATQRPAPIRLAPRSTGNPPLPQQAGPPRPQFRDDRQRQAQDQQRQAQEQELRRQQQAEQRRQTDLQRQQQVDLQRQQQMEQQRRALDQQRQVQEQESRRQQQMDQQRQQQIQQQRPQPPQPEQQHQQPQQPKAQEDNRARQPVRRDEKSTTQ